MNVKYYSIKEAASMLGISAKIIRLAIAKNELPCIKYSERTWRVSAVDLALFYSLKGGKLNDKGISVTSGTSAT